jgi:hypothetical protein
MSILGRRAGCSGVLLATPPRYSQVDSTLRVVAHYYVLYHRFGTHPNAPSSVVTASGSILLHDYLVVSALA